MPLVLAQHDEKGAIIQMLDATVEDSSKHEAVTEALRDGVIQQGQDPRTNPAALQETIGLASELREEGIGPDDPTDPGTRSPATRGRSPNPV